LATMTFSAILIIWLAVLFVAVVLGEVAHIRDRHTGNLCAMSCESR
jgi:hypothetical protein